MKPKYPTSSHYGGRLDTGMAVSLHVFYRKSGHIKHRQTAVKVAPRPSLRRDGGAVELDMRRAAVSVVLVALPSQVGRAETLRPLGFNASGHT
jgi:hypothetical protein